MKTLFKFSVLGLFLTAFSALSVFAQDAAQQGPDLATLFERFKAERKGECGKRDNALATGREIIEKFGNDELNKQVIDFVKKQMPIIEQEDKKCKLYARYNSTYQAKQWDEFMSASKEVMAFEGDSPVALDVLLTHVSTGYDLTAVDKIDKYNGETLSYAKQALQKIDGGKASQAKWGVFNPFNTKENTQAWMNYIAGFILWYKQNKNPEAITYLYKASTIKGEPQSDPLIYQAIGASYFTKALELYDKYKSQFEANSKTENDETKATLALARGYADRALDAYGRAHKFAVANPKTPADYKQTLETALTELYKFRFDGKVEGKDQYVSSLISKPMPDPSTAVTPVTEAAPTTATTSNTSSSVTTTPTAAPTTPAKTPETKTTAKKPVAQKKGNR